MKSFKKSILAAGLALAVVTTIGGVAVFAAGLPQPVTEPSTLCGYGVSGRSDMLYNTAYASTYYGGIVRQYTLNQRTDIGITCVVYPVQWLRQLVTIRTQE